MAGTGAVTPSRRAAIVYNPIRADLARLGRAVAKWETRSGWAPSLWLATSIDRATTELIETALSANVELVVAAGGDGTVSEVAAALRQSGVPLGIVPCGSANLFARNLRLPLNNLGAATRIAFGSQQRGVDVAVVSYRLQNGRTAIRPYLVMAGFGIDADMVSGTDPKAKSRFGWLAYVGPIFRSAARTTRASATWSLDGDDATTARLHSLIVGNCSTVTAGIRLLPAAVVDDGFLDVLAIRSLTGRDRRRFLGWAAAYQGPRHPRRSALITDGGDTLRYRTATTVTVSMHDPTPFQADGDLLGTVEWAEFSLDPLSITVKVGYRCAGWAAVAACAARTSAYVAPPNTILPGLNRP